jgi:hypothetical protein
MKHSSGYNLEARNWSLVEWFPENIQKMHKYYKAIIYENGRQGENGEVQGYIS